MALKVLWQLEFVTLELSLVLRLVRKSKLKRVTVSASLQIFTIFCNLNHLDLLTPLRSRKISYKIHLFYCF